MSLKSTAKWTGLPKSRHFSNVISFFASYFLSWPVFQKKNFKSTEGGDPQQWLCSCIPMAWQAMERPPGLLSLQAWAWNEDVALQSGALGCPHTDDSCFLPEEPQIGDALGGYESCHIKSNNFFNHFLF